MQIILGFLIFISILFQLGCSEENKQGELIGQLGCDKIEVVSDIEYSVENLEDYFKTKNIRVIKKI